MREEFNIKQKVEKQSRKTILWFWLELASYRDDEYELWKGIATHEFVLTKRWIGWTALPSLDSGQMVGWLVKRSTKQS
jgi:hypothetical protein